VRGTRETVLNVLATLLLLGCKAVVQEPAARPRDAAPSAMETCRAFCEYLEESLNDGDGSDLDEAIELDVILETATRGIDAPNDFKAGFTDSVRDSFKLGVEIASKIEQGGSIKLLRMREQGGQPRALFRFLHSGGVNYQELYLTPGSDGSIRVSDVFVYLSGETLAETFRRFYVQALALAGDDLLKAITDADQRLAEKLFSVKHLGEALQSGDAKKALAAYAEMPERLKKERIVQVLRLQACQQLEPDEYVKAIDEALALFPGDATFDLNALDAYFLKKRFDEYLSALDRLDRRLGGDPWLEVLRGIAHRERGDRNEAKVSFEAAVRDEPTLEAAHWGLVNLSLEEKDHQATAKLLERLENELGVEIRKDLHGVPEYAEFVQSDEYREWSKRRPE
jgi:hypothetical protein